jgi:hypothetical protein
VIHNNKEGLKYFIKHAHFLEFDQYKFVHILFACLDSINEFTNQLNVKSLKDLHYMHSTKGSIKIKPKKFQRHTKHFSFRRGVGYFAHQTCA